jgi:hypothetical protein
MVYVYAHFVEVVLSLAPFYSDALEFALDLMRPFGTTGVRSLQST